ncbi:ATP phosphoribosyltransferase regulatory subunit [Conexibacter sp. W3-3-2]|uniref:ATP phosphoribosyltransferase regulatory subunit n=1 Tax=Conexibacter sp. W3-3-2 TaxID=2675227 RepID=UPI0012BA1F72|nr:ATP phosphoribosyltransferase regulatory subunit [Conexibacter sp. W3-3-2]MTD43338.1 ATP phosphoribosyltransferase regulatory subunit [Conexibacter sp. W3-3-2]
MIHPLPSGTRDVLPDESRELRAITEAMRGVFERAGYGEVWTPAIEYESVVGRVDGGRGVYRLFDDHGEVLLLRSDLTVPIARLAATRYAPAAFPLRLSTFAHVYRGVTPHRGQMRETLQAGIELLGAGAPGGTTEVLNVLCAALDATGLRDYRIGLGDATLYPALLEAYAVPEEARDGLLDALVRRDLVELGSRVAALGLPAESADALARIPQLRGGADLLADLPAGPATDSATGLRGVLDGLDAQAADRVIFDLGLLRDRGYYTGAVFEVYAPGVGMPLGGGGRYDDLLARFGADAPAVGFALGVDKVHLALVAETEATA